LGFSIQKNAAVKSTQGMQMSDGDVVFTATEDMGGGYKAIASSAVKLRGRDTSVTARDATVSLVTPSFTLSGGSVEVYSLLGDAWAGAPASFTDGPDCLIMSECYTNQDQVSVSVPMGPVSLSVIAFESSQANDDGLPSGSPLVAAKTTAGNNSAKNGYTLVAAYAKGPVAVTADVTVNSANKTLDAYTDGLVRTRIAGTYDLGAAKVGLGVRMATKSTAAEYAAGVSVPMGALTVGLTYTNRAKQDASTELGAPAAADSRSGTTFGVQYDLSKTTNVSAQYAIYSGVGAVNGSAVTNDNEYRIRLMKSF
jgi:hypothetical protein